MIRAVTIYNKIDRLRKAIRREGTPAIQDAWDNLEPYVSTFMNGVAPDGAHRENAENRSGPSDVGKP
jgi:hypothetical protein